MQFRITRRRFLSLAALAPLAAVAGCRGEGFSILGYKAGAGALYDPNIRTVYVRQFSNRAFQTTPYRGLEVDITEAVVREIGKTTPFRVTSDCEKADTELIGNVVSIQKQPYNFNQLNQVREAEVVVWVDVVWRDLRTGAILSNPRPRPVPGRPAPNQQLDTPPELFDPSLPPPPDMRVLEQAIPVRIVATGRLIPELGESNTTAAQMAQNQIAVKIVSLMEKKW